MNDLAVLYFQYETNIPIGMPINWPAEVVELRGGVSFPPDNRTGWVQMTQDQYTAYLATYQTAYDTYAASIHNTIPAYGENYLATQYNSVNQLISETWYRDRISTGSYTTMVKQINYTYANNGITQVDTNYFTLAGSIYNTESVRYFTDQDNKITYTENIL